MDEFLELEKQQQKAIAFCKQHDIRIANYLVRPIDLFPGMQEAQAPLALIYFQDELTKKIKLLTAGMVGANPLVVSASSTTSPAQLITTQNNSPVFTAIPISVPAPATDEQLAALVEVEAPGTELPSSHVTIRMAIAE